MSTEKDVKTFKLQNCPLPYIANWTRAINFDTTIICEDGSCRAHKLVLASASPLLSAALDDQFPGEEVYYTIPDIKKEIMDLLLRFAYTGQIICSNQQLELVKDAMKFLGFIQLIHCTITETLEKSQPIETNQNIHPMNTDNKQDSVKQKFKDNEINKISEQTTDNNNKMSSVVEAQNNENKSSYNQNRVDDNNEETKDEINGFQSVELNGSPRFSSYDSFDEAIRNNDFDEAVERSLMGIETDKVTSNNTATSHNTNVVKTLESSGILLNNTKASFSGVKSQKKEGESNLPSNSNNNNKKKRQSQKGKNNSQTTKINPLSRKRSCKSDNSQSSSSSSSTTSSSNAAIDSQKDDNDKPMGKTRLSKNNSPLKKANDRAVKYSKTIKSSPRLQAKATQNTLGALTASTTVSSFTNSTTTPRVDSVNDVNSNNNNDNNTIATSATNNNTTVNSKDDSRMNDSPFMEGFEEALDEEDLTWIDSVEKSTDLYANKPHTKVNLNNPNLDGKVDKKKSSNADKNEEKKLNGDQPKNKQQGMNGTDNKDSPMKETLNNNAVTSEKENDIEVKTKSQEKRSAIKRASPRQSRKRSASPSTSTDSNTGILSDAPESKKIRQTRQSKIEKEKPTRASLRLNKTKND